MKIAELVDIGANLTHDSFEPDRAEVIERARAAGVTRLIVTGADVQGSRRAAEMNAVYPGLWSTAGIHPHHASSCDAAALESLAQTLSMPRVVAAGECGLDYFRDFSPRDKQREAFAAQLALAVSSGKPVFLHQRDAHADFIAILREFAPRLKAAVAHCFTGGPEELQSYVELGLYVGLTGWVCDAKRGTALREAVPHIPAQRLMVETDAPYLLPKELHGSVKGRRNEPALLPHVVRAVAALRQEAFEAVAAASTANARRFFALD